MLTNAIEAEVAIENLRLMTNALEALAQDMKETNPALFPVVSQSYITRIRDLQEEIFAWYGVRADQN